LACLSWQRWPGAVVGVGLASAALARGCCTGWTFWESSGIDWLLGAEVESPRKAFSLEGLLGLIFWGAAGIEPTDTVLGAER
jgi:hypothetical protein